MTKHSKSRLGRLKYLPIWVKRVRGLSLNSMQQVGMASWFEIYNNEERKNDLTYICVLCMFLRTHQRPTRASTQLLTHPFTTHFRFQRNSKKISEFLLSMPIKWFVFRWLPRSISLSAKRKLLRGRGKWNKKIIKIRQKGTLKIKFSFICIHHVTHSNVLGTHFSHLFPPPPIIQTLWYRNREDYGNL